MDLSVPQRSVLWLVWPLLQFLLGPAVRKGSDLLPTVLLLHVIKELILFILCQVLAVCFKFHCKLVLLEESVHVCSKNPSVPRLMLNGTAVREHSVSS